MFRSRTKSKMITRKNRKSRRKFSRGLVNTERRNAKRKKINKKRRKRTEKRIKRRIGREKLMRKN